MPYMILLSEIMMDSKKIFLVPVIISIIGHAALITASSMVDLRDNVKAAEIFTVQITQPQEIVSPKNENEPAQDKFPKQGEDAKPLPEGGREDTVDISSSDVKYAAYLAGVKKKILRLWTYPVAAYEKSEEGVVVIRISIDDNGTLAQAALMTSSGFVNLDASTLNIIRAAAPFSPLPGQYQLSRLHIIASFRYRIKD
jgi:TonB family protein